MLRVAALIQHLGIGLLAGKNRYQNLTVVMVFAKVVTKSALSVMNCLHTHLLLSVS